MIKHEQVRELIIKPVLDLIRQYSEDAIELLMFTCAVESNGGSYIHQVKGPALGIYQMEPATHNDIWQSFFKKRTDIQHVLCLNLGINTYPNPERMIYDLFYATAMARIHYLRVNEPLPSKDDIDAIWDYYKAFYNTPKGKAQKTKSINIYKEFIGQ